MFPLIWRLFCFIVYYLHTCIPQESHLLTKGGFFVISKWIMPVHN